MDELQKFAAFTLLNARQTEASTEQDATLVIDSAIRPPQLAWNLAGKCIGRTSCLSRW